MTFSAIKSALKHFGDYLLSGEAVFLTPRQQLRRFLWAADKTNKQSLLLSCDLDTLI